MEHNIKKKLTPHLVNISGVTWPSSHTTSVSSPEFIPRYFHAHVPELSISLSGQVCTGLNWTGGYFPKPVFAARVRLACVSAKLNPAE